MNQSRKILVYPGWSTSNYFLHLYQNVNNVEYASYQGAFFTLLKNYRIHRPDVIHLHWLTAYFAVDVKWSLTFVLRYLISIFDILILRLTTPVKLVWTVHNLYEHETQHEKLEIFAKRLVCKLCDKIIVLGKSAALLIEKLYHADASKIVVSAHGHFNELFPSNSLNKLDCRQKINLPTSKTIYLFPGAAKDYKGINELIEVFSSWNNQNALLLVAGKVTDSVLQKIKSDTSSIVVHNRFIPDEELPLYFKAADWTIVPYRRILTSATILTAMGLGSAIISPNMGTLPDYLDENGAILYNPNQKDSLLLSLEKSLTLNADKMGNHNKSKALSFNWNNISQKTLEILQQA